MRTIYKTLVEVKVLHEYYLTEVSGKSIFDYSTQEEMLEFLGRFFAANRPAITGDLSFEPHDSFYDTFGKHRLRLVPSYSGFRIMVEVEAVPGTGNSIRYRPVLPFGGNENIVVSLVKKNNLTEFTNERISRSFPSIYFFTNSRPEPSVHYPSLSTPVAAVGTIEFEQGELASDNGGDLFSYYRDENGLDQWQAISGKGFANEQDRILLPRRFIYSFPAPINGESSFRLLDSQGNTLQTIVTDVPASGKVNLNFSESRTKPLVRYQLEVTGASPSRLHEVAFLDEVNSRGNWGVINLQPRVAYGEFNLIDDENFIRIRQNPDGTETAPDYFEIRIKSRPTFWRYANEHGGNLKANAALTDYLNYDSQKGSMTSKVMRYATVTPTPFSGNGNTRLLPHPSTFGGPLIENSRIVTEIRVPRSDLFDV